MSYLDVTQIYLRALVRVKFRHSLRTLFAFETSYALEIFHAKGKQKKNWKAPKSVITSKQCFT